ncbi:hypothetical protein SEVIR_6G117367v4 [Setaria viridis]
MCWVQTDLLHRTLILLSLGVMSKTQRK